MQATKEKGNNILISVFLLLSFPIYVFSQLSTLSVSISDENGLFTPVRARLTDSSGKTAPLPREAVSVMYGRDDRAEGYGFQPDSSFYVDGKFSIDLLPGNYRLSLSKGYEYLTQKHDILVKPGKNLSLNFHLQRWIDMPARGWYSADDHIHIRRSPRENPLILKWVAAEDIHVGALLQMGDIWTTYFAQYAWGKAGNYQEQNRLLTPGQEEPRTHEIGHTISLGADDFVRDKNDYYLYDHVFDRVHELDGLTGYAHQGMSFHGYRGMTMDILQKKVDFLELLQFCVDGGPLLTDHYYFFLDLGYKLTATAGSDFPWCGKGPRFGVEGAIWSSQIGNARFYTYVPGEFTFDKWKENFKAGRTFVSSGPVIDFKVNGKLPGDQLQVSAGEEISISAEAFGHEEQIPLKNLVIIAYGEGIDSVSSTDAYQSSGHLFLKKKLKINEGVWLAAFCQAGPAQVAHTTPVYITIGDGGFYNRRTLLQNLSACENYLQEIEEAVTNPPDRMDYNAWRQKDKIFRRIADTRAVLAALRDRGD
jgi:hypothetical protein